MSDKKIQVELREAVARQFAKQDGLDESFKLVREAVAAALPPEYPEGTVAWVTIDTGQRNLMSRKGERWVSWWSQTGLVGSAWDDHEVTKVEPLHVLGDDEIAVKRVTGVTHEGPHDNDASLLHRAARNLDAGFDLGGLNLTNMVGRVLHAYADALEAEGRP